MGGDDTEELGALARGLLASATPSVLVTDVNGVIRRANRGAERLCRGPAPTLRGLSLSAFFHHEPRANGADAFEHWLSAFSSGKDGTTTYLAPQAKGRTWRPFASSVTPLHDGNGALSGYLFMASPAAGGASKGDERLKETAEPPEAERTPVPTRENAEATARAKTDFLARMSHEIRTPMNSVIGLTDLALQTRLTSEQRDYIQTASVAAKMLLHIINDILDFSRAESGQLALDRVEFKLRACLGDALRGLSQKAADKGLELLLNVPAQVPDVLVGDPYRLQQVIVNLVSNALKFTEQGEVIVSAAVIAVREDDCTLAITVRDSGPGIPAERHAAIFEAFTQADDDVRRKFGGSGLGLAICAQLVSMMRGQVRVESQVGKGSTFTLEVPFGRAREQATPRPRVAGQAVLVVEDHPATRQMLCETFSAWKMEVVAAESATQAQALVRKRQRADRRFNLIVLDTTLPDDGPGLRRTLAADNAGAAWLLLVPGQTKPRHELTQPVPGARWFVRVSKPVLPSELTEAVQNLLGDGPGRRPPQRDAPEITPPPRAMRILVAEDNMMNQKVVQAVLRSHAHEVTMVPTGRAALEKLATETFDLVLMDVEMPDLDGLEATRRWRAMERERGRRRVPMVALTAQVMNGDRERCLAAGLDSYLSKPLDPAELQRTIVSLGGAGGSLGVASPGDETPRAAEPFDREALKRRWGDDAATFTEIGTLFRSTAQRLLGDLAREVRDCDPAAGRTLHQLKGMLLNVAADEAVAFARELEGRCKDRAWELVAAGLAPLEEHVTRIGDALLAPIA